MNSLRYFVLILLTAFAAVRFNTFAQDDKPDGSKSRQEFKVIEETKDYILKECDSGYYYSHGKEMKDDFIKHSFKYIKIKGALSLPLISNKTIQFKDDYDEFDQIDSCFEFIGENNKFEYFLIGCNYNYYSRYYLIDKRTSKIDTMDFEPIYSPFNLFFGFYLEKTQDSPGVHLIFKNLKTKISTKIILNDEFPDEVKWIDERKFLLYIHDWKKQRIGIKSIKYYLVQIKQ